MEKLEEVVGSQIKATGGAYSELGIGAIDRRDQTTR